MRGATPPSLRAPLRVLVADADQTFAGALQTVLSRDPMVDVVAVATTVSDAAEGVERLRPDVALIGDFPGRNLGHLRAVLARLDRVAVILLLRPDGGEPGAAEEFKAAAFLRREPSAEETLRGFLEVAAFAVGVQISRTDD
jgi:chemotaxis response regulator CheB